MDDSFPDEYLFAISTKTPWFADIANYYREHCKIVRKMQPIHG